MVVSVKGKDNTFKDLTVCRKTVSSALHWLVKHNSAKKDININYDCLASLPSEGVPSDMQKIYCGENIDDEIDRDRDPLNAHEIPFNEDTELSSTVLNPVVLKAQKPLITDNLLQQHRNTNPLNECKIELLATMAFPTLFPD